MCFMSSVSGITIEEFVEAAEEFCRVSDLIHDGWVFHKDANDLHKSFMKKETFSQKENSLLKTEFVIYYNLSYGVPAFSFNIWNCSGMLLSLEDIRNMSLININERDFYSVITQQEHPIFFRPYFIMHPCHTEAVLTAFKDRSKNIIVTSLSLITPLLRFNLPLEYGL